MSPQAVPNKGDRQWLTVIPSVESEPIRGRVMKRRLIYCLALAALFALSGQMARADGQVIIVGRYYPAPGREAELEARLLRIAKYLKQEEPTITYRLHRSAKEPTAFMFYEVYPSQAVLDQHRALVAALRKRDPPPDGIFGKPPEVETYGLLVE
jgi:quinol monooxygenase YgiN